MKVVFLDFDGVLNTFEKDKAISESRPHEDWVPKTMEELGMVLRFDKKLIQRVNVITARTDAKIVISSSWRIGYLEDWADVIINVHNAGLRGFIVGRTPRNHPDKGHLTSRPAEILTWLQNNKDENIESFVILDDTDHFTNNGDHILLDHLVKTDHTKGIQEEDILKAIAMLENTDWLRSIIE